MGKPLSRPDCLRQNPACLRKGEEEDGYIEDCYIPQRSIYDTMRINEQIDQGGKPSQPSKNTLDKKGDGSTLSSNGTLGAPSALEAKGPESRKLDERVIFDALKLSSEVSKSAPAPPRRRPNADKKENVNRRSWKSFMPPNFPEFAERIEASLSEVSEAGASNQSLQEKQGSAPRLTEMAKHPGPLGCTSEPLTMEHAPLVPSIPEIHEVKQLSDAFCGSFQDECQPLLDPEDPGARDLAGRRQRDLSSATWPRAMKNLLKAGQRSGRHDTLEADDTDGVIEMVPLSPCLSEELLDPAIGVLITPNLREKTESELRFEEDERLIMMEGEEGLEGDPLPPGEKVAEERDCGVVGVPEGREQFSSRSTALAEGVESLAGGRGSPKRPSPWEDLWDEVAPPQAASSAPVPQETPEDLGTIAAAPGEEEKGDREDGAHGTEVVTAHLDKEDLGVGDASHLLVPEQFSDTDSVQIFLELEELCMGEEDGDSSGPAHPEVQDTSPGSEELGTKKESEQLSENSADAFRWVTPLETSVADSAVVSDLEDFDATYGSQVASTTEPTLSESCLERETSGDSENVLFPSSPSAKDAVSQHSLSSLLSQMEECGGSELLVPRELSTYTRVEEALDVLSEEGEPVAAMDPPGCQGESLDIHVYWAGREVEEDMPPAPTCGMGRASPNQDELATTAEELDSQVEFGVTKPGEDSGGKEVPAGDVLSPSERTDLSIWDVPELASEDEEVADRDQETFLCRGHTEERGDAEVFQVPFPLGFAPWLDSEEPVKYKNSSSELNGAGASGPPCLLEGSAQILSSGETARGPEALREKMPKVDKEEAGANHPLKEEGLGDQRDLELLFGQGGYVEDRGWELTGGCGLASPFSSSPGPPEDFSEAPLCLGDFLSRMGEDTFPASPLASSEVVDGPSGGPEELPGMVAESLPVAGPVETKETTFSSLPTWFASTLSGEEVVVDATSLPSNVDLCGPDGPPEASVPVFPDMDDNFPPPPPPLVLFGTGNSLATPEERLGVGEGVGTLEEPIQATQEVEDLATLPALSAEGLDTAAGPPEREDDTVLWALGGILPTLPLRPASTAPGTEEQLTWAVPSGDGPSTNTSASSLAAEGPPDGLVPDNEVTRALVTRTRLYRFVSRWVEVRRDSIGDLTRTV